MKDRVKQVQDHYKLTQKQFAGELCVAEGTISSIYRGRTAPTSNLIQAIHMAYPAININWLMFGEGEMLQPLTAETSVGGSSVQSGGGASDATVGGDVGQNGGYSAGEGPSLFDAPAVPTGGRKAANSASYSPLSTELQLAEALSQLKNAKENDKPKRKIKEIRVFFDDGTFEAFVPSSK